MANTRQESRMLELPDGMDPETSFFLVIRIISDSSRGRWYEVSKAINADLTHFKDFVEEMMDKFPGRYGEIAKVYYFCHETKSSIPVTSDQDLLAMFAKHKHMWDICIYFVYHDPSCEPPPLPLWEENPGELVEVPCTPSMTVPSHVQPSQPTQTVDVDERAEDTYLHNPEPNNEHVGIDEEGMYLVEEPVSVPVSEPNNEEERTQGEDPDFVPESDDSETDNSEGEEEEMIKDSVPHDFPDLVYDKDDPPMEVGSLYPSTYDFKIALASHAIKHEFEYGIKKCDPGRYRVYCSGRSEGCRWRIHASKASDNVTIKVKRNPFPHSCSSTRRCEKVKVATKFWVCEKVKDWLIEQRGLGAKELQRRLKDEYKVLVPYKRVYYGKELALSELFGDWEKSFDNLFRFKKQIETCCPGSVVAIDHQTINEKVRFLRLFFAMKPCIDGFIRGCRPYLAVDSTFLTGRFKGQLCIACAVDGHNWMYPVAVGVIDTETNENWIWFMSQLKNAIGNIDGLTFCTDAGHAVMGAYEGIIPALPDKQMWPKSNHGFFMHPPLLKPVAGRRKNHRYKGAREGSRSSNKGRHKCPICKEYGHHWNNCKNGDPADIAAMLAERGLGKKKNKAQQPQQPQSDTASIVPSIMTYPSGASSKSHTGSNNLELVAQELVALPVAQTSSDQRKKGGKKRVKNTKLPTKIDSPAMGTRSKKNQPSVTPAVATRSKRSNPSVSLAMGTRSKRKLDIQEM